MASPPPPPPPSSSSSVSLGKETTEPAVLFRRDLDGILPAATDGAAVTVLALDLLKNRVGFEKLIPLQASDDPIKKALFLLAFAGALRRRGCEHASGSRRECDRKRSHIYIFFFLPFVF
ncbi:hypothetical protein SDJN03_29580, partial [Cucurbita argyrosperma subsp. sororia]